MMLSSFGMLPRSCNPRARGLTLSVQAPTVRTERSSAVQAFAQKGKKVEEKMMTGVKTQRKEICRYRGVQNGTILDVIDNSGAIKVMMIGGFGRTVQKKGRIPEAGVGEYIKVVVKRGHKLVHNVMRALVVEQRALVYRQDGTKIRFGRNACVLVNNKNEPLGNRIPYFVMREIKYVNQKVYSIGKGGI